MGGLTGWWCIDLTRGSVGTPVHYDVVDLSDCMESCVTCECTSVCGFDGVGERPLADGCAGSVYCCSVTSDSLDCGV